MTEHEPRHQWLSATEQASAEMTQRARQVRTDRALHIGPSGSGKAANVSAIVDEAIRREGAAVWVHDPKMTGWADVVKTIDGGSRK